MLPIYKDAWDGPLLVYNPKIPKNGPRCQETGFFLSGIDSFHTAYHLDLALKGRDEAALDFTIGCLLAN